MVDEFSHGRIGNCRVIETLSDTQEKQGWPHGIWIVCCIRKSSVGKVF
jgi:hypothetical protein